MSHDHDPHDHDHDHGHDHHDHSAPHAHPSLVIEDEAGNIEGQIIIDALQNLLVARNLLAHQEVTQEIGKLESPGVHQGAKIVARAWKDPGFKQRLLGNGKSAAAELDIKVGEAQLVVVENTAATHNLITCTLCSCYPRSILGQAAILVHLEGVIAPARFGSRGPCCRSSAWICRRMSNSSSTTAMRTCATSFCQNNRRGTESWSEDKLAELVTRDCMIGVVKGAPCRLSRVDASDVLGEFARDVEGLHHLDEGIDQRRHRGPFRNEQAEGVAGRRFHDRKRFRSPPPVDHIEEGVGHDGKPLALADVRAQKHGAVGVDHRLRADAGTLKNAFEQHPVQHLRRQEAKRQVRNLAPGDGRLRRNGVGRRGEKVVALAVEDVGPQ